MATVKNYLLPKSPRVFYGYWIVVATFFCLFTVSGFGMFAFSLFVKPLEADMGWGRGGIMVAFTIFYLVAGMSSPFVGRLIDRYAAKRVITIGALIFGLGLVLASQISSPWHFYVSYAVAGVGMATMGNVSSTAIVSNWFKKRRGMAIGVLSAGIGAGGFVMAPIIGSFLIPNFGWRTAYLIMGGLVWVLIVPLALFVIKTRPADMGLYPDGEQAPDAVMVTGALPLTAGGLTLKMALATSTLWLIIAAYLTGNFSQVGTLQSLAPYLEDIGFPAAMAAGALSGFGLGSLIGKLFFGWLCDRILPKYVSAIGLGIIAVGIIIFRTVSPETPLALVWLNTFMVGLGAGGWLPTMSMLVSTNFGLVAYGSIYGVANFAQSIGVATGPLLAGYMYDITGSYYWAFIIFIALHVISIPAVLAVRRPKSL